jgi:hypothetical protein
MYNIATKIAQRKKKKKTGKIGVNILGERKKT